MDPDHVLQGTGNEKELLLQTQLLSLKGLIVRVENFGDVLCHDLVMDGTVVVTHVKLLKVEGFTCFRFPEAQRVGGVDIVSKDSHVVRHTLDDLRRNPAHAIAAVIVGVSLCATAETHFNGCLRTRDFPGVAKAQPFVCDFELPAVLNLLAKDAEFVPDTVADCRNLQGGKRIQIARRKTSEPPIAQARFRFLFQQFLQVQAGFLNSLEHLIVDTQVYQAVSQARSQ